MNKQKPDINIEIDNKIYFTQMANKTIRDKNLTGLEKAILLLILSHNQDKFTISRKTLFNSFADSQHMIRKSLLGLKNKNYLKIIRSFGKWIYKVNDFGLPYHNGRVADNVSETDGLSGSHYKNTNLKKNNTINSGVHNNYINKEEKGVPNHVVRNNIEETEINAEPIQKTHPIDIDAKYQQNLIEINNRYDSNLLPLPKFTTDELLDNSDKFLQNLGIGFEFNPRNILNKIYSNLPKDFAIKEDKDDIATIKQFIDKYSSVTTAERDAMSKRLYQGIETMVKIYVIKKYGEEFRGKLYPEQLDKNLILYLNCNPTLKYCLSGWSNDVDGVYNEVVRIIRKKTEKQKREFYTQWQREISAENAERQYMERELIPEEEKIARRKRTESILRGFRDAGKGNIADDSENPYFGIRTEEEEIELANLRKMTLDLFDAGTRPDPSITARIEQLLKKIGKG